MQNSLGTVSIVRSEYSTIGGCNVLDVPVRYVDRAAHGVDGDGPARERVGVEDEGDKCLGFL